MKKLTQKTPGPLLLTLTLTLTLSLSLMLSPAKAILINPQMGLGIRGNGETIAAHWGGLARLVEEYGAYGTVAGGSSASITIFLYESSLLNPFVSCSEEEMEKNPDCEKERLSFLIKSFEGIVDTLPETKDIVDLKNIYSKTKEIGNNLNELVCRDIIRPDFGHLDKIKQLASNIQTLMSSTYGGLTGPLLKNTPNWELITALKDRILELGYHPNKSQLKKIQNLINQLQMAYQVFGKFNARDDEALFVRPGLINMKNLAFMLRPMANFLAARGIDLDPQYATDLQIYIRECSKGSKGQEWGKLKDKKMGPFTCGEMLHNLVLRYDELLRQNKDQIALRENDLPGQNLPSFNPILSTAVSYDRETIESWQKAHDNFMQGEDKAKWDWKPEFKNIKFGYWVKKDKQEAVEKNLKKICEDEKDYISCKGMVIGNHSWKTILSLSPAEPGLSRIQHFHEVLKDDPTASENLDMISLGGWSDLLPQKILKAAGAQTQTLLTRRGYQSFFVQGVAMRLGMNDITPDELHYLHQKPGAKDPSAEDFQHAPDTVPRNPKQRTIGDWAQSYNLHNPASSLNQALLEAAAVLCTHWDGGDVSDWKTLIRDSYNSLLYLKDNPHMGIPTGKTFLPVQEGELPQDLTKESGARYLSLGPGKEVLPPDHPWFNRGCSAILEYVKDLPVHQTPFHPVGESLTSANFDEE